VIIMLFGREPAAILAFLAGLLKVAVAFGLPVTDTQQTLLNTFLAAAVGIVLLIVLRSGAVYATIVEFAQACMALVVGFGMDWSAEKQASVMALVGLGLAFLGIRPQVQAPVPGTPVEAKSPLDKTAA
jgi:hypothetical protein